MLTLLNEMIEIRARARRHFGRAVLAKGESYWVRDLARVVSHAKIPWRSPCDELFHSFTMSYRAMRGDEWWGTIELWPDTPQAIWFVRPPQDSHSELSFAIAPTDKKLQAGVDRVLDEWLRWRRSVASARTVDGDPLHVPNVAWSDLYLPDALLTDLQRNIEAFAVARPLYESFHLPYRRGILFHGPPGNGKTMATRAVVTALNWPMIFVSTPDLRGPGSSLGYAFDQAAATSPSVLVFEDVDSLLSNKRKISAFLNRLDGFTASDGVLVIATTNHPEVLDASLTSRPSRFDRIYEFAPPLLRERVRYLLHLFDGLLPSSECEALAVKTEGFSMAFLRELFVNAALSAAHRGDQRPRPADVEAAYSVLKSHHATAKGHFSSASSPGFV